MKNNKILVTILMALSLVFSAQTVFGAVPAMPDSLISDGAGVLSAEQIAEITKINEELAPTGAQIAVVTVDFLDGMDIADYGAAVINEWGVGDAERNNGIAIVLAIGEDNYFVATGSGIDTFMNAGNIQSIIDTDMEPSFAAKNYGEGTVLTAKTISEGISNHYGAQAAITKTPSAHTAPAAAQSAGYAFVYDNANVISDDTQRDLFNLNTKLNQETGSSIIVYTTNDAVNDDIEKYARGIFDELGIGEQKDSKGMLLLLAIEDDNYYAVTGRGLSKKLSDSTVSDILYDYLETDFAKQKYDAGIVKTVDKLYDELLSIYGVTAVSPGTSNAVTYSSAPRTTGFFNLFSSFIIWIIIICVLVAVFSNNNRRRYYNDGGGGGYYPPPRRRFIFWGSPRHYWGGHHHHHGNTPPPPPPHGGAGMGGNGNAPKPPGSGTIFGGGTSGGGAGRSSGGAGRSSSSSNKPSGSGGLFGGGSSLGGGAGRSSGGKSSGGGFGGGGFGGGGRSGGGGFGGGSSSGGGGGSSSGGGAGRR